ncbi:uncharacterized protein BCR38DRAFT_350070 [Pseudomassariella vexata]|uniref:G-patch domain-containing protein n=1 Tax=Pseudomassariella vexata TaxID=1141098 RepID=A0A1Y2DLH7_9PEZI|nr:uncharacterized protein BCR38DRAFT_350070 [Pseudomassariella vexata]ORY60178.1 hypothetical protein BCR38DRAFT_350070 [Pseudomassariella vexata]
MAGSEDEEDYMSMDFSNIRTASLPETSLQRKQRLKREAEVRGRPKPKAELEAEEAAAREQALSTSLLETAAKKSKGLSMMKKMGFVAGKPLGAEDNAGARAEPIKPSLKEDRGGIGLDLERKRRLDEEVEKEGLAWKKVKVVDAGEFRDRVRKGRERERCERLVYAAQKTAVQMEEERDTERRTALNTAATTVGNNEEEAGVGGTKEKQNKRTLSTKPLKSINVLWRGLVRKREEAERDRRMRYDLQQSLSRLPTYEDDNEDEDDKQALGKTKTAYLPVEDLEEEDPDLDEFSALEPDEQLRRLVEYLRKEYRYCFWCKYTYPDEEMDGCPGLTEEDHD